MTRRFLHWAALLVILAGRSVTAADPKPDSTPIKPLPRAHAHNDYLHPRPLIDALDQGFCSVEADIHLVNGQLLVAHDRKDVTPERTLESLYLDPLRVRAKLNGGKVYRDGPRFWLLIDVKSPAAETYPVLRTVFSRYRDLLTSTGDKTTHSAVTVVLSGTMSDPASRKLAELDHELLAGIDGRPADLGKGASAQFVPWVSASWASLFAWRGEGEFPADQRERLRSVVKRAHAEKRLVRFWATPERENVWRELSEAGVDLLNTDRLAELRQFLTAEGQRP